MKPRYGWVHVADWLPCFLVLAAGCLAALIFAIGEGNVVLIAVSLIGLVASYWPLSGYVFSWVRKDTGLWYQMLVSEAVKSGEERVLDVGCGLGRSTVALAKALRGGRVTGVDVYSKRSLWGNSIEQARLNAEIEAVSDRVVFTRGDVAALPFGDEEFDVVVAAYVTHELRNDDARMAMMKETFRVLRPGGKFVAGEIPRSLGVFKRYLWFGLWFLSLGQLVDLRRRVGFSDIKVVDLGMPVLVVAVKLS